MYTYIIWRSKIIPDFQPSDHRDELLPASPAASPGPWALWAMHDSRIIVCNQIPMLEEATRQLYFNLQFILFFELVRGAVRDWAVNSYIPCIFACKLKDGFSTLTLHTDVWILSNSEDIIFNGMKTDGLIGSHGHPRTSPYNFQVLITYPCGIYSMKHPACLGR